MFQVHDPFIIFDAYKFQMTISNALQRYFKLFLAHISLRFISPDDFPDPFVNLHHTLIN